MENPLVDILGTVGEGILEAFRTVFLTVCGNEQRLEAAYHVEELLVPHITHVSGMEPAVNHGLRGGNRILPVARHHILAADYNLSPFAVRQ